ncbi:hypothetical protein KFK09_023182 [Dendrobium nobile]|uniref:Uncharacterized protein n=1 Tax=Dendrobium nobile TaxID=94219 RepID=A0A8T3ALG1_DENNO|nr:hypothetical protein KFK09_023182 [Dendrobium nobile]
MGNCLVIIHEKQKAINQSSLATQLIPAAGAQERKNIPISGSGRAAIRIKLVISKQELKEMIRSGNFSIGGLISGLSAEESRDFEGELRSLGWSPALESIPEGNDL